jgi:hypothetical protein
MSQRARVAPPRVLRVARRSASSLLALALMSGALPTSSNAEIAITAQASADGGGFLPYVPPPAQPAGLCLVDTGVNLNPDTEGVVVDRTAIDGGSGDDVSLTSHGTVLAMMAAAPSNGWGMVGTAPTAVRVVSVRIVEPGQTTFPFSSYATGIEGCLRVRERYDIRVINLSLGSSEAPSSQGTELVANAAEEASDYGVAVVAAAGNDDAGAVEYPAAYPSVLSVGATETSSGAFCSFSNRGPSLRLLAPGCGLDGADPASGVADSNYWQGTSESSAIAAAALAALDAYRPDLSPTGSEELITGADGGVLNIAQAFRNDGLGAIVAAGEAAEPRTEPNAGAQNSPQSVAPSNAMNLTARFVRPRARLERVKGRLLLVLSGRPPEAQVEVRFLGHRRNSRGLVVLRATHGAFTEVVVPTPAVREISSRYIDAYDAGRASPWITLSVPRTDAKHSGRARR